MNVTLQLKTCTWW